MHSWRTWHWQKCRQDQNRIQVHQRRPSLAPREPTSGPPDFAAKDPKPCALYLKVISKVTRVIKLNWLQWCRHCFVSFFFHCSLFYNCDSFRIPFSLFSSMEVSTSSFPRGTSTQHFKAVGGFSLLQCWNPNTVKPLLWIVYVWDGVKKIKNKKGRQNRTYIYGWVCEYPTIHLWPQWMNCVYLLRILIVLYW